MNPYAWHAFLRHLKSIKARGYESQQSVNRPSWGVQTMEVKRARPLFYLSLSESILGTSGFLLIFLLVALAAPFESLSLLYLVAAETFFANIILWSAFSISQLLSAPVRKARFYDDHLEIEGRGLKKSFNYGDVEYISTQYPTKYRTQIHLHLKDEKQDLVVPSNPRSSKLRRRLFPWLKERIPINEYDNTLNQGNGGWLNWGLVPSIVLIVAITVGFVFGGVIFPALIFAGSVGSILWFSWTFLKQRKKNQPPE